MGSRSLSFGLLEVADSDANTILNFFIDTLGDICEIIAGDRERILSIKIIISDLVNLLLNAKLKAVREELLPKNNF